MQELIKKLLLVQKEIKNPTLNKVNPFFKSRYADLPSILDMTKPILSKNELFLTQVHKPETDGIIVETIIYHISGEKLESSLFLPVKDKTPQGYGSSITYARRYSILSMLGISADEDDDGNIHAKSENQIDKIQRHILSVEDLKNILGFTDEHKNIVKPYIKDKETFVQMVKDLHDKMTINNSKWDSTALTLQINEWLIKHNFIKQEG